VQLSSEKSRIFDQGRRCQGDRRPGQSRSAVDDVTLGNVTALLKNFQPVLATLNKADGHSRLA
jgi:hypothetical protein